MAIKVYSPIDFEDTSSGLSIDGDFAVDTNTFFVDVSTDRVGIGTTSPAEKLHVAGNARFTDSVRIDTTGTALEITGTTTVDGSDVSMYLGNSPSSYGFYITYVGSGFGNTNAFRIQSTNAGNPKTLLISNQDGIVNFPTGLQLNGAGVATQSWVSSQSYATQSYVNTQVSNLVDSAPGTLDTLNELAAALGDDPNFATTVTNSIATKVPLSGNATITGIKTFATITSSEDDWQNSPISILERNSIGSGSTSDTYAPNLNFHWGSRVSNSLWMNYLGHLHWGSYSSTGVPATDGTFKAGTLYAGSGQITSTKVGQWDTAYSWGNHASEGYLTGITSSDVTAALGYTPYQEGTPLSASSLVLNNIEKPDVNLEGEFGWDANDGDAPAALGTYGGSYPDGVYFHGSSTTYTIYHTGHFTGTHISNWNTAYTYSQVGHLPLSGGTLTGDLNLHTLNQKLSFSNTAGQVSYISHHDSIGQLTIASDNVISLRETDSNVVRHTFTTNDGNYTATGVITASGGNSSNWNTAYSWGNHASAGYLTAHPSITEAADVNNSGGNVIQDLTFDENGHVTATGTVDLDSRYYTETEIDSKISTYTATQSGSDFTSGTFVRTSIVANVQNGDSFLLEITGKSYSSSNYPFKVILQGYIYNNTFISTSALSYGGAFPSTIKIFEDNGDLCFWWARYSYWNSFKVTVNRVSSGDSSPENLVQSIYNAADATYTKQVTVNVRKSLTQNISNGNWDLGSNPLIAGGGIEGLTVSNGISGTNFNITGVNQLEIGNGVTLNESTDRPDLLMIKSSTSSWGGLQVSNTSNEGIISLMINGNEGGLYDDQNGEWILKSTENGGLTLGYNNVTKLLTVSDGVNITGRLYASSGIQVPYGVGEHRPMVVLSGATNYGLFHTEATNDKFTFDFNGDQKFQFSQDGIFTINGNTITTGKVTNWDTAYGWGDHSSAGYITSLSGYATTSYVDTAVSNLVDSAPGTLDTLNELAAALGDDPNFATTVTNSIATKLPLTGGTVTGMTIFEDGLRIGTGNHYTDGRASITFGEGNPTTDSMYIEYDGENLSGDNNAIIFGSSKAGVGDVFRITYGGSVLIGSNAVATQSWVSSQGYITDGNTNWDNIYGFITASSNITGSSASAPKLTDGGGISTHPGTSNLIYTGQLSSGTAGLFATINNANSIITVNKHPGNYNSQLGFSSNGNIYYRNFNNSTAYTTQAWNQVWHSGNFSNNSANWNTAYGWGDHAGLYLGASAKAADSNLLDGLDSSQFLRSDTSDTVSTGRQISFYSYDNIESNSGDQASLEVYQDTSGADAFMQFHVGGDFALYFGLDGSTNDLAVGGWSMGANKYRVYHAGNLSLSTLGYTGATNANYITNNNQLTNGAGYITGYTVTSSDVTTALGYTPYQESTALSATTGAFSGIIYANGNQVRTSGSNADVKFSVWSGTTYGIGMTSGVTYGGLNDYAMTFCMNNDTDRGFWWGYSGQSKSSGAMSLTTSGHLTVEDKITTSKNEIDFTPTSDTVALDIRGTGTPNDYFTVSNATGGANDVFLPIFFYKAATYGYNGGTNRYPSGVYGGGFVAAVDDTSYPSAAGAGAAMHFNARTYANNGPLTNRYLFSWGSWLTTHMAMTAGGNLLIGKTSDNGEKLQINGNAHISGDLNVDGTITGYAPSSHTHVIADVTSLQSALDGKQAAGLLDRNGLITTNDWNSFYTDDALRVVSAHNFSVGNNNAPDNNYNYGAALTYRRASNEAFQLYFPENQGDSTNGNRRVAFRTGWNGGWSSWRRFVDMIDNVGYVTGGNDTGFEVHSDVGYNQNPGTYFLLRGQADNNQPYALKILLTGNASGNDIEWRRLKMNGADDRMYYAPEGQNQITFEYTVVTPSDARLKDNVKNISNPIDKLSKLNGCEFDWNSGVHEGKHDVGVIAQEVEAVIPEAVGEGSDGIKSVAYDKLVPLLIESVKEQQAMIEELKQEIENLKK